MTSESKKNPYFSMKPIINKINELNRESVVNIDFDESTSQGTVQYSDEIKLHRSVNGFKGTEEVVRAYLISRLVWELGYEARLIEVEKEYNIGRPKVKKARIDVILRDSNGHPYFFIEVKAPDKWESDQEFIEGQLFQLAKLEENKPRYLVYYTSEFKDEVVFDKAIIIDYSKYSTYEDWEEAGFPSSADELPGKYGKPQKEPLIKNGKRDLDKNLSGEELTAMRKNLHNVLWGGGGTSDNEIFSSLVNIILAKIQDEGQTEADSEYQFQVFAYGKNGEELESSTKTYERINKLYKEALRQKMNLDKAEIENAQVIDKRKFGLNKLLYTVQQLERISFVEGRNNFDGRDILGEFFEGIIRDGFKQSKGQFFTPINIVRFILFGLKLDDLAVNLLNNENRLPYIIDPSAGSGSFLIEAMKMITETVKYKRRDDLKKNEIVEDRFEELFMPDNRENKWAREYLYGLDINFDLGTATKVNMILHGDGSTNIFVGDRKGDGLLPFRFYSKSIEPNHLKHSEIDKFYFDKEINGQFDVVISNPPFSIDLAKETKRYINQEFIFGEKKNSENLFIERWYQLLKPGGRLGAVLPESVFDTTENKYIRLFLFKYFKIDSVVSLPQVTFEPYTSTKTSLIFATKKTQDEIKRWDDVWAKYTKEYRMLKTKVDNYIKVYIEGKDKKRYPSIKKDTEIHSKENISRYLKDKVTENGKLGVDEILNIQSENIKELSKTKNLNDEWINELWVFSEVSKELNYEIFMAEADYVGYKRTTRSEKLMPNDLYLDEGGQIDLTIDIDKILNVMRTNSSY